MPLRMRVRAPSHSRSLLPLPFTALHPPSQPRPAGDATNSVAASLVSLGVLPASVSNSTWSSAVLGQAEELTVAWTEFSEACHGDSPNALQYSFALLLANGTESPLEETASLGRFRPLSGAWVRVSVLNTSLCSALAPLSEVQVVVRGTDAGGNSAFDVSRPLMVGASSSPCGRVMGGVSLLDAQNPVTARVGSVTVIPSATSSSAPCLLNVSWSAAPSCPTLPFSVLVADSVVGQVVLGPVPGLRFVGGEAAGQPSTYLARLVCTQLLAGVVYSLHVHSDYDDGVTSAASDPLLFALDRAPPAAAALSLRASGLPDGDELPAVSGLVFGEGQGVEVCVSGLMDPDTAIAGVSLCLGASAGECAIPVPLPSHAIPPWGAESSFCASVGGGALAQAFQPCDVTTAHLFVVDAAQRASDVYSNSVVLEPTAAIVDGAVIEAPEGVRDSLGARFVSPWAPYRVHWYAQGRPCVPLAGFEYQVVVLAAGLGQEADTGHVVEAGWVPALGDHVVGLPGLGPAVPHGASLRARVRGTTTGGTRSPWVASHPVTLCSRVPTLRVSAAAANGHGIVAASEVSAVWAMVDDGSGCPLADVSLVIASTLTGPGRSVPTTLQPDQPVGNVSTGAAPQGTPLVVQGWATSALPRLAALTPDVAWSTVFVLDTSPPAVTGSVQDRSPVPQMAPSLLRDSGQAQHLQALLEAAVAGAPVVTHVRHLAADWTSVFVDPQSGIESHQVCVGYKHLPGNCDGLPWTAVGLNLSFSGAPYVEAGALGVTSLSPALGPLTVRVRARNLAGLDSVATEGPGVLLYPDSPVVAVSSATLTCAACVPKVRLVASDPAWGVLMLPSVVEAPRVTLALAWVDCFSLPVVSTRNDAASTVPSDGNATDPVPPAVAVEVPGLTRIAAFLVLAVPVETYNLFQGNTTMLGVEVLRDPRVAAVAVLPGTAGNTTIDIATGTVEECVIGVVAVDVAGYLTLTWGPYLTAYGKVAQDVSLC